MQVLHLLVFLLGDEQYLFRTQQVSSHRVFERIRNWIQKPAAYRLGIETRLQPVLVAGLPAAFSP